MNLIWDALQDEITLALPDARLWVRVTFRLVLAIILAAIVGWEREREGKDAGLRTHVLVALGAAIFVLAASENGASANDMTRVVQGMATGIGFIGGGVILKLQKERDVKGLTTASSVWLTARTGRRRRFRPRASRYFRRCFVLDCAGDFSFTGKEICSHAQ